MSTQHDHIDPEAGVSGADLGRFQASRRRFTRAGLSSTVVLGSLASKPVLGAAPYHCTVSGQASGTLSRQGAMLPCQVGDSRSTWLNALDWTEIRLVKGALPNNGCSFSGPTPTQFNGFSPPLGGVSLKAAFWGQTGSGNCTLVTTGTNKPASMYQVLKDDSLDADIELGRVVVVSLLNSLKFGTQYGATTVQVIEMFNAVFPSGSYQVAGRNWGRAEVLGYLKLLYKP